MRRVIKAVVFDLWETLVDWDRESATNMLQAVAGRSGLEPDEFHRRWDASDNPRYIGPIRDALSRLQMFYAQRSGGQAPADAPAKPEPGGTGPAQSSGRLWVPGQ